MLVLVSLSSRVAIVSRQVQTKDLILDQEPRPPPPSPPSFPPLMAPVAEDMGK